MEVITLKDGEVITRPGVYDMSLEWYHDNCCAGPSISSSGLRAIDEKTPRHFWASSVLNPDRREKASTKSLEIGGAIHARIFGDQYFARRYVLSPFDNFRTKDAQNWRDAQSRIILKQEDLDMIEEMYEALINDPDIPIEAIAQGEVEKSMIWRDPWATRIAYGSPDDPDGIESPGIWLKSRIDVVPLDDMIVDYKTTTDASRFGIEKSITDYGYHQQLAIARDGVQILYGRDVQHFGIIAQEKAPPYVPSISAVDEETIVFGALQNRRALKRFAECIRNGIWPGYDNQPFSVGLRKWRRDELEFDQKLSRDDPRHLPSLEDLVQ